MLCLALRGMRREQLKGHLDLLLLSVLTRGAAHGYAIIGELRNRSEGAFDLPEGTVYPALHRLEKNGLVRSYWADESGRRRRLYELTAAGATALTEMSEEWRAFSRGVGAVLA